MEAGLPKSGASCTKQLGKHWILISLSILLSSLVILFVRSAFLRDLEGWPYAFTILSGARRADAGVVRSHDPFSETINMTCYVDHCQLVSNQGNSVQEAVNHSALQQQGHTKGKINDQVEASAEGDQSEAALTVARKEAVELVGEQGGPVGGGSDDSASIEKSTGEDHLIVAQNPAEKTAVPQGFSANGSDSLTSPEVDESPPVHEAAQEAAVQSASQQEGPPDEERNNVVELEASTERDHLVAGVETARRPSLYIFSAHHWDSNVENEFEHLVSDVGPEYAFLLFDETHERYSGKWQNVFRLRDGPFAYRARIGTGAELGPLVLLTNTNELRAGSNLFDDSWTTVHGKLVPVYRAVLVSNPFEYVWIIESDVRCKGSYKRSLEKAIGLSHDVLGRDLKVYGEDNKDWDHWEHLEGPIELSKRVGLFLPVMRLSRFAFEILSMADYDGTIRGYQETYIPTILSTYGGTFGELPGNMFGLFEFRPKLSNAEYGDLSTSPGAVDILFHPVVDD